MEHTELAICIPTCNRATHIKEYLEMIVAETQKLNIHIYIFDASEGNSTKEVVDKFLEKGYENIWYEFRPDQSIGARRTYDAYIIPNADYVWICGDKFLIKPENYELILVYIKKKFDIITLYDKGNGTIIYNKPEEMLRDCMWFMTHMGSVIIKKELVAKYSYEWFCQGNINSFWHTRLYANAMDKKQFKGIFLHLNQNTLKKVSKFSTESKSASRIWEVWIKGWYEAVMELPKRYDKYKPNLLISAGKNMNTLTFQGFLFYGKQTNLSNYFKYRSYLKKVTNIPRLIIFAIACLPVPVKIFFYNVNVIILKQLRIINSIIIKNKNII